MSRKIALLSLCAAALPWLAASQQTGNAAQNRDSVLRAMPRSQREARRRVYLDSLAVGRRLWQRSAITDYQLQTRVIGSGISVPRGSGKLQPIAVLSTVHQGKVVEKSRGRLFFDDAGPPTVDALFEAVERDMRWPGQYVDVLTLHPRFGFPTAYRSGDVRDFDGGLDISVDSFAVLSPARTARLTRADSALLGRMLLAEDRRDSADAALAEGTRHPDARVRLIARRARIRIRDPRATGRDSIAPPPMPLAWDEPFWKPWYRALRAPTGSCDALRRWMASEPPPQVWAVRLRATDLVSATCAPNDALAGLLRNWIDALPADASRRTRDSVSWHAAAHAIVALARMRPAEARPRASRLARHGEWHVRAYAAKAAGVLADTATLRTLARDSDDNVKEQAIEALSKLTCHFYDSLFIGALNAAGAQAVRAAAIALKGSSRPDVAAHSNAAFSRWVARGVASARDVRVALLEAAGRPASDDRPPPPRYVLPPRAVDLALGAIVRLRVRMSPGSGGGSFVVRLRGDAAPLMAAHILALVRAHYYDNTDWHRVEHDFVVQGGGPGSNEYVGAPQFLRDELGGVSHLRGTVGMSTRGHDTGDAQWFVNLRDNRRLDRDYTVFAEVVDGMEVVDGIQEGDVITTIEELKAP